MRTFSTLALLIALVGCYPGERRIPRDRTPTPSPAKTGVITLETPLMPPFVVDGEPLPPATGRTLQQRMAEYDVPGVSVAVIVDGEIAWARGYGVANRETGHPVTERTLFQAASISKPVAAMGALHLVQSGRLGLDDDVNPALVSWQVPSNELTDPPGKRRRPVTLRHLLSHTAGTTVHGFPGYSRDTARPTTVDVLEGRGNTDAVRVDLAPGSQRRYSGGGYTIVQLLVSDLAAEENAGETLVPTTDYAEFMRTTVLAPLEMNDSTFEQPLPAELHDRAATGYREPGHPIYGSWRVYPEQAAAGLWTTPTDLARFALAVQRACAGRNGPVLDARFVQEMLTAPVEDGYGLGLSLDGDHFGHGGANAGFRCSLTASFEGGSGAVIMTNSDNGWPLLHEFLLTIADHYDWPGLAPAVKKVAPMSATALARYAGTYRFEWFSIAVSVADTGDRLKFVRADGHTGVLRPESTTTFFDSSDGSTVDFVVEEASGVVTSFQWSGITANRVEE